MEDTQLSNLNWLPVKIFKIEIFFYVLTTIFLNIFGILMLDLAVSPSERPEFMTYTYYLFSFLFIFLANVMPLIRYYFFHHKQVAITTDSVILKYRSSKIKTLKFNEIKQVTINDMPFKEKAYSIHLKNNSKLYHLDETAGQIIYDWQKFQD